MQEAEERDDLAMMKDPSKWPLSFWLPVKRYKDGGLETGWLEQLSMATVFLPPPDPVVYLGNMARKKPEGVQHYDSLEAVVAAGWVVD